MRVQQIEVLALAALSSSAAALTLSNNIAYMSSAPYLVSSGSPAPTGDAIAYDNSSSPTGAAPTGSYPTGGYAYASGTAVGTGTGGAGPQQTSGPYSNGTSFNSANGYGSGSSSQSNGFGSGSSSSQSGSNSGSSGSNSVSPGSGSSGSGASGSDASNSGSSGSSSGFGSGNGANPQNPAVFTGTAGRNSYSDVSALLAVVAAGAFFL